jgi:hypothetical protein
MYSKEKLRKVLIFLVIFALLIFIEYWCVKLSKLANLNLKKNENTLNNNKKQIDNNGLETIIVEKKELKDINLINENSISTIEEKKILSKNNEINKFPIESLDENSNIKDDKNISKINNETKKDESIRKQENPNSNIIISPINDINSLPNNSATKDTPILEKNKNSDKEKENIKEYIKENVNENENEKGNEKGNENLKENLKENEKGNEMNKENNNLKENEMNNKTLLDKNSNSKNEINENDNPQVIKGNILFYFIQFCFILFH